MLGICIVLLSVAAAAYLIFKRYYAPGALLFVGLMTLALVCVVGPDPILTGKKATGMVGLDVVQTMTNLLKSRAAGLGMNIMVIAGFSTYMDRIGASGALVRLSVKPLSLIRSPYIVMAGGLAFCILMNVFIPSAAGLALLMMVSLYPIMIAAGVSRQSAAATILCGGCLCLSPSGANNLLASELLKVHVMEYTINAQLVIGWVSAVTMIVVHFFAQRWFDAKDLASGAISKLDFSLEGQQDLGDKKPVQGPFYYAIFPLVPVFLLFFFSPLMYKGIKMEVVTAILVSTFFAFAVDTVRRMSLRESLETFRAFAQGMGKVFTSTVFLIVSAEVFAAGLTKSGGIATLIQSVSTMDAGAIAIFSVMFAIVVFSAFVMGSGNAAFFSFAPMIPDAAAQVGGNAAFMIAPLQLGSGMARSMSPVAGVTIAISGLCGIDPFQLIRRTIPVMIVTVIATYLRSIMLI